MSGITERAADRLHRGLWGVLVRRFRVPEEPPHLPPGESGPARACRPSPNYLRYLKCLFWIFLPLMDVPLIVTWIVVLAVDWRLGLALTIPLWILIVAPDIVAYVALHLRYDATWYVLSDRAVRIRRGIWIIHETTITFENVQNVEVRQGPLQRRFGIAEIVIMTAGGGGGQVQGQGRNALSGSHLGLIQGVENAPEIRELILSRARRGRGVGLGDDRRPARWTHEHLAALRLARNAAAALAG